MPPLSLAPAPLTLRRATTADEPSIQRLSTSENMGLLHPLGQTTVAEARGEDIVGFLRIMCYDECGYVNPIVVSQRYRHQGIGRMLMEQARSEYGELRFVSRGTVQEFYRKLGAERIPWDTIAQSVSSDCTECSMRVTCNPQPMRILGHSSSHREADDGTNATASRLCSSK